MTKESKIVCKECGKEIGLGYRDPLPQTLIAKQLCFSCNFWDEVLQDMKIFSATGEEYNKLTDRQKGIHEILTSKVALIAVDKRHQVFYANIDTPSTSEFRGFSGRTFEFELFDGSVITSSNVWCRGDVPEHYWDRFPVNIKEMRGM